MWMGRTPTSNSFLNCRYSLSALAAVYQLTSRPLRSYDVQSASTLEMKVWYRSQSKKKSKKRVLVASATHSLGDLLKRVEFEGTGKPDKGESPAGIRPWAA